MTVEDAASIDSIVQGRDGVVLVIVESRPYDAGVDADAMVEQLRLKLNCCNANF